MTTTTVQTAPVAVGQVCRVVSMPGMAAYFVEHVVDHIESFEVFCINPDHGEDHDSDCYAAEWVPVTDPTTAVVALVGDGSRHRVPVADLTPLDDGEYCTGCGQIGCGHNC